MLPLQGIRREQAGFSNSQDLPIEAQHPCELVGM